MIVTAMDMECRTTNSNEQLEKYSQELLTNNNNIDILYKAYL